MFSNLIHREPREPYNSKVQFFIWAIHKECFKVASYALSMSEGFREYVLKAVETVCGKMLDFMQMASTYVTGSVRTFPGISVYPSIRNSAYHFRKPEILRCFECTEESEFICYGRDLFLINSLRISSNCFLVSCLSL